MNSHFERSKSDQLTLTLRQSPAIGHKLALIDFGITTELSKIKNKAGRDSDLSHLGDRTRYSIGTANPVKQRFDRIFHPFFNRVLARASTKFSTRENPAEDERKCPDLCDSTTICPASNPVAGNFKLGKQGRVF